MALTGLTAVGAQQVATSSHRCSLGHSRAEHRTGLGGGGHHVPGGASGGAAGRGRRPPCPRVTMDSGEDQARSSAGPLGSMRVAALVGVAPASLPGPPGPFTPGGEAVRRGGRRDRGEVGTDGAWATATACLGGSRSRAPGPARASAALGGDGISGCPMRWTALGAGSVVWVSCGWGCLVLPPVVGGSACSSLSSAWYQSAPAQSWLLCPAQAGPVFGRLLCWGRGCSCAGSPLTRPFRGHEAITWGKWPCVAEQQEPASGSTDGAPTPSPTPSPT